MTLFIQIGVEKRNFLRILKNIAVTWTVVLSQLLFWSFYLPWLIQTFRCGHCRIRGIAWALWAPVLGAWEGNAADSHQQCQPCFRARKWKSLMLSFSNAFRICAQGCSCTKIKARLQNQIAASLFLILPYFFIINQPEDTKQPSVVTVQRWFGKGWWAAKLPAAGPAPGSALQPPLF